MYGTLTDESAAILSRKTFFLFIYLASVECNREEFRCKRSGRCVPRFLLNTRGGCSGRGKEFVFIQCRDDGKQM